MIELNKIYAEDCIQTMSRMEDNSIDLIITDPPYNIGFNYDVYKDNLTEDDYVELLSNFQTMPAVFIHYPEEMIKYICQAMGNPDEIVSWIYNAHTPKKFRLVCWFNVKPDLSKVKQPYKNQNDKRILRKLENGEQGASLYDWWHIEQVKNVSEEKTEHPCQIPTKVIENIILTTTEEGDTIYDPFMGSGTTALACIKTNRNFIGSEISQTYVDLANKRIDQHLRQTKLAL